MAGRIIPLLNRIVVKRLEAPLKSSGGIILNSKADENFYVGKVVKVGSGFIFENGKTIENLIKADQTVLLPSYSGQEIEIDNEKLYIYKDTEILGVLE